MIMISILILIVAMALPSINRYITPIFFTRIASIIFIYAGVLSFNTLYIQSIESGIGIFNGLFQVTVVTQVLEVFLFLIGSLILIVWPKTYNLSSIQATETLKEQKHNSLSTSTTSLDNQREQITLGTILESKNKVLSNISSRARDYSLIVIFSTLGSSLLISSSDLVSMYLSIELQSFGLYILATLYRESESATSAGLKYFLLGGLSSCLILLGAGLIYSFTGLTNFESIYSLSSVSDTYNINQGLSLGLIFILVGFLFKISAAPLHNWSPDVYDDSPTIVTIWLTIMAKISIIILLLELHTQIGVIGGIQTLYISSEGYLETLQYLNTISDNINQYISSSLSIKDYLFYPNSYLSINGEISQINNESYNSLYVIKNLLLISSLLSLIIGTVVGLAQIRIKRLLAYSTISHIGFMLLALAINTEQSIDSLIFYLIQYTITNLNTFLIIIALSYIIIKNIREVRTLPYLNNQDSVYSDKMNKFSKVLDIKYIRELKGQFQANPVLSLSLTVSLFSMAGTPPLIGFFSKQFVLYSAVQSGYYFMAVVAIIVSVISASYYLKIIKILHTETEIDTPTSVNIESSEKEINNLNSNLINDKILLEKETTKLNHLTNYHSYIISVLTLTILLFVLKPSLILNSTQLLSLSLFNF